MRAQERLHHRCNAPSEDCHYGRQRPRLSFAGHQVGAATPAACQARDIEQAERVTGMIAGDS
ncbi:MAG: hypothetical protein R3F14_34770 [Polyangiaceae bacterium]